MDRELIPAWIAVLGGFSAAGKYFLDAYRERSSIQASFLVEIDRLLWVIKRHRKWFGKGRPDPLVPFTTDVYDEQIKNVGKLPKSLAIKVVKFYGFVKFLNKIQATRVDYLAAKSTLDFDVFYADQLKSFEEQFSGMFRQDFPRHGIEPTSE